MVSASRSLTELRSPAWALVGPTGVGKSRIALQLAQKNPDIELINVDSVSFYRGFDIGSAKPSIEEQRSIPHHLIDVAEPMEVFSTADFLRKTNEVLRDLHTRGKRALFVGGSGFYLKGLLFGLWDAPGADHIFRAQCELRNTEDLLQELASKDPKAAARIGSSDRYRLTRALELLYLTGKGPTAWEAEMPKTIHPLLRLISIDQDPGLHQHQLNLRIHTMLENGLLEEVAELMKAYPNSRTLQAVGYKQVADYLQRKQPSGRPPIHSIADLAEEIALAHRQLAKAQRTWIKSLKPAHSYWMPDQENSLISEGITFYQAPDSV
jgi:tRNA dimethylallyltransferase